MGAERGDRETWGRLPPAPGKGGLGLRGQGAWEEGVPREGEVAVGREARGWRDLGRRWPGGGAPRTLGAVWLGGSPGLWCPLGPCGAFC